MLMVDNILRVVSARAVGRLDGIMRADEQREFVVAQRLVGKEEKDIGSR